MTRINCIPPEMLIDSHLIAEYRELPRVYKLVASCKYGSTGHSLLHPRYKMGPGHVAFFYSRLDYIDRRFYALVKEMQARGFRTTYTKPPALDINPSWYGSWTPTFEDMLVNIARLKMRGGLRKPVSWLEEQLNHSL